MPFTSQLPKALDWVDSAYQTLNRHIGLTLRDAQINLSKDIATSLVLQTPLVAEAPTGTGKSLAYLLGALAQIRTSPSEMPSAILVATATKALQAQLIDNDIPMLVEAKLIDSQKVALAKGRNNYICLAEAARVSDSLDNLHLGEEYLTEDILAVNSLQLVDMRHELDKGTWDGDFDSWGPDKPEGVKALTVSSENCLGNRCAFYSTCAFYKARRRFEQAEIIVSNHNLTLMDLLLSKEESGGGVFPMDSYRIIFDEAHHLPEKALQVAMREASPVVALSARPRLAGVVNLIRENETLSAIVDARAVPISELLNDTLFEQLQLLISQLNDIPVDSDSHEVRFARGVIPDLIQERLSTCSTLITPITLALTALRATCSEQIQSGDLLKVQVKAVEELTRRAREVHSILNGLNECIQSFISPKATAKWMYRFNDTLTLHSSPLEGAELLRPILWDNSRILSTVMISATLQDMNGFSRFEARSGVPAHAQKVVLPHIFPYSASSLFIPAMSSTPKFNERAEFIKELTIKLPQAINPKEATLILFPSWMMLKLFTPILRKQFGASSVLVQGEKNIGVLRQEHSDRVAAGKPSILIGATTLAEGLDLPGNLCSHVIILALPFSVPTSAVEQEVAELLGRDYFSKRSLPDAMIRLVQMVGRLLRRETDVGKVTVFDRRLASTSYGRSMLAKLPPFKKEIEMASA